MENQTQTTKLGITLKLSRFTQLFFACFDSLRPSQYRDGFSWVEPVLSRG